MLSTKQNIIKNFNKKASTYGAAAEVQAYVAAQMAQRLKGLRPQSVLEIGCGTGLLSQYLIQLFPHAALLLTDVAPAMLMQCQQSLSVHPAMDLVCMDGEQLAL